MPIHSDTLARSNKHANHIGMNVALAITAPTRTQRMHANRVPSFVGIVLACVSVGMNLACCVERAEKSYPLTTGGYEAGNTETIFSDSENPAPEDSESSESTEAYGEPETTGEPVDCNECWACNPPPLSKCIQVCTGTCASCC